MPKTIKNKDLAQSKHVKFLDALTKQAILGYNLIMNKLLEDIKKTLKKEKLTKSDKLPAGWTGEVPTINLNFNEVLSKVMDKYIKSMEWMMLGGYADKDAIKAAKDLGLTKIMIPGVAPSAYLNSIDSHREHYKDIFGLNAPDLPENVIKIAFDQIRNRCVRVVEEFGLKLQNRIIDAIDQIVKEKNMKNLLSAHSEAIDNLLLEGGEDAVASAIEDLDDKLGIRKITKAFREVQEKLGSDWERTVDTEASLSSAVGTHQSMLEIYGEDNDDVTVIIEGFYDDKICDFCLKASKKPDGSFKKYKMKDFQASGYNFSRKKSEWKLCIPKMHYNCFVSDMDVMTNEGWKSWEVVNGKELFLSVNPDTEEGEWVKAKKLIIQKYHGDIDLFSNRHANFATTPDHNHVVIKQKSERSSKNAGKIEIIQGKNLPKYNAAFLATIPKWSGKQSETIEIAGTTFNTLNFMKFLGIYLSEGNTSFVKKSYQIKISQKKFYKEFLEVIKLNFDKTWNGKEAIYIPLKSNPRLGQWFADLGKSWEKYIPSELKELSTDALEAFLEYYRMGDGSLNKNKLLKRQKTQTYSECYFTSSDKMASDIGEILLKCGYRPSYYKQESKTTKHKNGVYTSKRSCWRIGKGTGKKYYINNIKKEKIHYNGFVYDVELEKNHTLIVRRNGKVVVSGNCRCQLIYIPKGFDIDKSGNFIPKP